MFQASLVRKQDTISKITRAKRTGGLSQMVEHLVGKCKVLSLNPSIAKKPQKNQKTKT
jgi:hypothetical protein